MPNSITNAAAGPAAPAAARFALTRLVLTDFRSYRAARLVMDARPLVLTGPNGAGKTNLLEAVSYLSPGRGLRGARLADVARVGARFADDARVGARFADDARVAGPDEEPAHAWSVAATVTGEAGESTLGSGWRAPAEPGEAERRSVRIDGAQAAGPAAFARHIGMVWLTPAMDRLFSGPPAERRRFLDRLVFAIDAAHATRVQRYDRARRHRARLLRAGAGDDTWLGAVERSMAENAVAIAAARLDLAIRLEGFLPAGKEPFPRIALGAGGLVERWLAHAPALDVEERFREHLAETRRAEAEGTSADGPQRSDLLVTDRDRNMAAEQCSTGEQKAMLIALIMAHARLMERQRRRAPVLLLDEIAAHLDERRRGALFEIILDVGAQAWLTGTEEAVFRPLGAAAQFFTVRPGMVEGA